MLEQTDYITDNRIKEKLLRIGNCILNKKQNNKLETSGYYFTAPK